jgi:glycosyltransferase involved in cell wall biosynthesis
VTAVPFAKALHQVTAGFHAGDAISREAMSIRDAARSRGLESEIFTDPRHLQPASRREARSVTRIGAAVRPDTLWLLHFSAGSRVNAIFRDIPGRRILLYHNITPPRFFRAINGTTAAVLEHGRRQLGELLACADLVLADSAFNAEELRVVGDAEVAVVPVAVDTSRLQVPPDARILERFDDGLHNVLFVGRGAPNKRMEELILTFHLYRERINSHARLIVVGSFGGTEPYHHWLSGLLLELGQQNVYLEGFRTDAELAACYRVADVFLCLSEHEGFCVPLVEAMHFRVPIVAFAAAAVPETLGDSGVLLHSRDPEYAGEIIERLRRDPRLRHGVLQRQLQRLSHLRERDFVANLFSVIERVLI